MKRITIPIALLAFIVMNLATPAIAADVQTELNWKRHWRNYARRCIKVGDKYYTCALYETRYPSSRGVTTQLVRAKTAVEIRERVGINATVRRHLVRPKEDIEAVTEMLPEMAVGHYGWIHSAEVTAIGSPTAMIVEDIRLFDPVEFRKLQKEEENKYERVLTGRDVDDVLDWRFEYRNAAYEMQKSREWRRPVKLLGFSTRGLEKEQRWTGKANPRPGDKPGTDIVIVDEEKPEGRPSSRNPILLVAVPATLFRQGISDEKEFLALLKAKGFTKEKFVELVVTERRANSNDPRKTDSRIFATLDGRLYDDPDGKFDKKK